MANHVLGGNHKGLPEGFTVGKTEKFDLKVVNTSVRAAVKAKVISLEVGEGCIISGVERDKITSVFPSIHSELGRKFSTHRVDTLKYRVLRTK